jgi:outer membrane porin, OprD family
VTLDLIFRLSRQSRFFALASVTPAVLLGGILSASPTHAQVPALAAEELAAKEREYEPDQQNQIEPIEVAKEWPAFWDGSSLVLKPRTYYFNRDRDQNQDNVGWALGGGLEYRSGWAASRVQIGATLYTSQKLYGPEDRDGTLLFKPGQEPFTVLGEAYAMFRLDDISAIRIGRQTFDLPWLARHDNRMVPNTFEAVAIGRRATTGLTWLGGYVDRIKLKNDDEFIPMSEAAGATGTDKGLGMVAAQYTFADGSLIGATNQTSLDVMNTFFIKAEKSFALGSNVSLRTFAQYTDQRSHGDALIGDFATHLIAVKAELFYPNMSFRLAVSDAGNDKGLQSPFGGPANYLAGIVDNFDRAGERAWMLGASYDFGNAGARGLSMFTSITAGDTPDSGPSASPDETEIDLTVDYKFSQDSALDGLSVRVRAAWVDEDEGESDADDIFDFRVIVNYSFGLID